MAEQKNDHPYVPPGPEDVRGPCPMLNLLANHGHLPHNGKGITRDQLADAFVNVVGCSRLFGNTFASKGFAKFVRSKDPNATLSLDLLNRPFENGGIEHWASLSREDAPRPWVPGTAAGPPSKERIEECLTHIGKTKDDDEITMNDMAKIRNYLEKKKNCPEKDKLIAAVEAVLIHGVGHGKKGLTAKWYRSILGDERFPDDWTKSDYFFGFGVSNIIGGLVELGFDKKQAENNPYTSADYSEQFDENGKPIPASTDATAATGANDSAAPEPAN